jgi:hypothetical protein
LRKEADGGGGGGDGVMILQQNPVICRRDKVFRKKLYYNIVYILYNVDGVSGDHKVDKANYIIATDLIV